MKPVAAPSTRLQNRTLRLVSTIGACLFSAAFVFTPAKSNAVVTVTVGNASVVETTSGGAITVYGGMAGGIDRCIGGASTSQVCNNCALKEGETSGAGDALLLACNERRIHDALLFRVTIASDAIDGEPTITNFDGSSTIAQTTTATKGTVTELSVPWSSICDKVFSEAASGANGTNGSRCMPLSGSATGSIRLGVSLAGNGLLNATGDDQKTIKIIVRNIVGNTAANVPSLAENCSSTSINSEICYFEVGPGDEKAVVRTLLAPATSTFPSAENTQFRSVRFLWAEGDFSKVDLASAHADLTLTGSGVATFDVSPRRIEPLDNDKTYFFKNALVDAAGNVGLYSASSNDRDCIKNPNPASDDCRIVTPSEVVGVLDQTNCFIATAAYGTSFATELTTLRDFRDQILSRSNSGVAFTRWYYETSPRYAKMILEHPVARATVRAALVPVVWFAGFTLAYGPMKSGLLFLASLIVLAALVTLARRNAVRSKASDSVVKVRKDARRSLLPTIFLTLLVPALASGGFFSKAEAQTVKPLEELSTDDETPPEPEYPYPGAKGSAPAPTTAAKKKKPEAPAEEAYPTDLLDNPSDFSGGSAERFDAPADQLETPNERIFTPSESEPKYVTPPAAPRKRRKPVVGSGESAGRPRYTGTKPRDPNKSPYQKPLMVNEDGDYIFEKAPEKPSRQYAPPKRHRFSKLPGREAPASISMDGQFNYKVKESDFSAAAGVRFGFMSPPDITNASNGLTFKDIYGDNEVPALLFEYEYPLTRAVGRIGLKFETGAYAKQAAGRFKKASLNAQLPEEKFTFVMIPLQAMIHYRFQFADSQLFVPFAEGGAAYNGIVELRDDSKAPRFGGALALIAGGGVNILLDWLDKSSIRQLDAEYGINHVWFTAQYRQTFGLKKDLDLSSHMISAGFTFDY